MGIVNRSAARGSFRGGERAANDDEWKDLCEVMLCTSAVFFQNESWSETPHTVWKSSLFRRLATCVFAMSCHRPPLPVRQKGKGDGQEYSSLLIEGEIDSVRVTVSDNRTVPYQGSC